MLDLRGVQLPSPAEIRTERARRHRRPTVGLPEDFATFAVCGPFMRLEELELLVAESKQASAGGVVAVEAGSGTPLVVVNERGGVSGPLVSTMHRRAAVRCLLAQVAEPASYRVFDCLAELERGAASRYVGRSRFVASGLPRCTCLVDAVERAEAAERDLERAAACAAGLARRAHRVWWRSIRAERRREVRAKRARVRRTSTSFAVRAARAVSRVEDTSPLLGSPSLPPSEGSDAGSGEAGLAEVRPLRLVPPPHVSDAELAAAAHRMGRPFWNGGGS
jgi:hypothetical protein